MTAVVCPSCGGDGRIPDNTGGGHYGVCPTCNKTGVWPPGEVLECPSCSGSGRLAAAPGYFRNNLMACPKCKGTGLVAAVLP